MFGMFNKEEMETLKKGLRTSGEFELFGDRFKNDVDGDLYVLKDGCWIPIQEALSNAKKELAGIIFDNLNKVFSNDEESEHQEEDDCADCAFREECDAESDEREFPEEIEDMFKEIVKVIDVSVDDYNVTCTFADGEKITAFCHPKDRPIYSLDTGIMVCLLKRLSGGTRQLNEALHQALGVYEEKQKKIEEEKKRLEEEEKKRRENEKKNKKKKARNPLFPTTGYLTLQPGSIHIRFNGLDDVKVTDLMTGISDLIKGFHE